MPTITTTESSTKYVETDAQGNPTGLSVVAMDDGLGGLKFAVRSGEQTRVTLTTAEAAWVFGRIRAALGL